jgi:hypothetical protein
MTSCSSSRSRARPSRLKATLIPFCVAQQVAEQALVLPVPDGHGAVAAHGKALPSGLNARQYAVLG